MSCRGQPSCAGFRRSNTQRSRPGSRHGEQRCCRPRLPAHSAGSRPQVSARRVRKGAERPPRPHPVYAGVVAAAGAPTRAGMAPGWLEPSWPHRRSRRGHRGRWGPRPRRDGRDRSGQGRRGRWSPHWRQGGRERRAHGARTPPALGPLAPPAPGGGGRCGGGGGQRETAGSRGFATVRVDG